MKPRWFVWGCTIILVILLMAQCLFIVDVTECAVITFFGNPTRVFLDDPGLKWKWPFPFERVRKFDSRLQMLELPKQDREYLTRDKKNVMAQVYLTWRIADPVQFMQAVGAQAGAEARLAIVMASALGAALGEAPFSALISESVETIQLSTVVGEIAKNVKQVAQSDYGIEVVDLQLNRLNYHEQNRLSVFQRMREERRQIATRFRSEGEEEAMKIRAETERERAKVLADAETRAAKSIGEGEAEAARIYAEAIALDPEFYRFYRSLQTYDKIFTTEDSVVIPSDSELMRFLLDEPIQ
ncbi:MAG: protease modulator HflC [Candidatus Omnitrophota bacterium]|jgi:membrane protease subunit HflC|nr:MAG: protease modulator HflC [Candidatus Omnitrophota bacterium]